jgi:hypothetical protein
MKMTKKIVFDNTQFIELNSQELVETQGGSLWSWLLKFIIIID